MFAAFLLATVVTQSLVGVTGKAQSPAAGQTGAGVVSSSDVSQLKIEAEAGDVQAQVKLAEAYQDGLGIPKNEELAGQWYQRAAQQGNPKAQNNLANMYRLGSGVEKNKATAVNWYRKAARQKYPPAMFNLGTVYYNGDGVEIDDVLANVWFLLAQRNGNQPADGAVKRMATSLSPSQKVETYLTLAEMLTKGEEIPPDETEATEWYRKAADQGHPRANVELAQRLILGTGVSQDYAEARRRCEYAAKQHFGPGAFCLGLMNKDGLGSTKDADQAAKWFARAADLRDDRAMLYLGEMYWKGEGVKENKEMAYMWLSIAANSGVKGAAQDQQQIVQEMDPKTITKARKNAAEWLKIHPNQPLVLRRPVVR